MSTVRRACGACYRSAGLAIVAPAASWAVVDRRKEPVDRARAVENAQDAFPTSSLDGAQNAPPTTVHRPSCFTNEEQMRKMTRLAKRDAQNELPSSLRSDE